MAELTPLSATTPLNATSSAFWPSSDPQARYATPRRNPFRYRRLPARYSQSTLCCEPAGPFRIHNERDHALNLDTSEESVVEAMLTLSLSPEAPMDVDTRESPNPLWYPDPS